MKFQVLSKDPGSKARTGRIETARGASDTPVFMPVGTAGSVKSISPGRTGVPRSANHPWKYLSPLPAPGRQKDRPPGRASQIHGLGRPILTDSGGFQVFSLAKINKIEEEGVLFQSHIDGSRHLITPESAVGIQRNLGSDIMMCFDECTPYPVSYEYASESVMRTFDGPLARRRPRPARIRPFSG